MKRAYVPYDRLAMELAHLATERMSELEEAGTDIDTSMLNLEEEESDLEDTVLGHGVSELAVDEEGTLEDAEPSKLDLSFIEAFAEEESVAEADAPSEIELGLLLDEPELERDGGEEGPAVEMIGDLPAMDGGGEVADDGDLAWNKFADAGQIFSVTAIPFEPLPHRLEIAARSIAALPEGGLLVHALSGDLVAFDQDLSPHAVAAAPPQVERIYSAFGKVFVETEAQLLMWSGGKFLEVSPSDTGDLFSYPSFSPETSFASGGPSSEGRRSVSARTEWENQYFSLVREADGRMVVVRTVGTNERDGSPDENIAFELSPVFARATGIAFDAKRECIWIAGPFGLVSFGRR